MKPSHKSAATLPREVNVAELTGILDRVKQLGLDEESFSTLCGAVETLAVVTAALEKSDTSLKDLRYLLFGPSTEKTSKVLSEPVAPATPEKTKTKNKQKGHGRNGAGAYTGATKVTVPHPTLVPGTRCECCERGRVYPFKPSRLVRVTGMAPLVAVVYERTQLRCNTCGELFTAPSPPGVGDEKYDASATAMVALMRYGTGMPFHRLEQVQADMGVPVPAATQWDLAQDGAKKVQEAFEELVDAAAQSRLVHNDDTHMPVVELMNPKTRPKDIDEGRTGMFTTGIVAERDDGKKIALFFTGAKHAGENLNEVLLARKANLSPIIQMCDALSRNEPQLVATLLANCNAHARRNFVKLADTFPSECAHVIDVFKTLFANEAETRKRKMNPQERLLYHQEHSTKLMEDLRTWMVKQLDDKEVEPNSALGGAMAYVQNHWDKLTLFLRVPGVPLENNICERALKMAIRHRNNSLLYRTCNGARVGDVFMSLIHSARLNGEDPFHYLTSLLRHHALVEANPEQWLPWNFRATLQQMQPPA